MNDNVPFYWDTIGLIFFSLVPIVLGILSGKERTYTMNGLFALGQSVPWLTNDHFENNLFEKNCLMPHLTQQLLLPFLLHVHKRKIRLASALALSPSLAN